MTMTGDCPQSQRSILAHQILVFGFRSPTTDDYLHEKRILRLEDEFWRIRTDTGELADAERDALRACLDGKGFKTAMIDDNLAIAGEVTWQEIVEPYEGKADVYPF
jgi:hypothetical protein